MILILQTIVESFVVVVKLGVKISKISSPKYFFNSSFILILKSSAISLVTSSIKEISYLIDISFFLKNPQTYLLILRHFHLYDY